MKVNSIRLLGLLIALIVCLSACGINGGETQQDENIQSESIKLTVYEEQRTTVPTTEQVYNSSIVYVTPYGERYHRLSTCGGKNSRATTLNNAKSIGRTPCKKCVH